MCKNYRAILKTSDDEKQDMFFRARCKQWNCEECAVTNARIWRAYIIDTLNKKFPEARWSFCTITIKKSVHKLATKQERILASVQEYQKKWNSFITRMKALFGKFEYVRVIEMHKSGVLHIHFLASVQFDDIVHTKSGLVYSKKFLSVVKGAKFGYIANTQNLDTSKFHAGGVAGYITKYMTKEKAEFHQAVHGLRVRRVQTSRNFGSPSNENENHYNWKIRSTITQDDLKRAYASGKELYDLNRKRVLDWDDFTLDNGEEVWGMIE